MEGLDTSWVASTPALPGAGQLELAQTGVESTGRAMVGGDWDPNMAGLQQPDVGLNWVATGDPNPAGMAPGVGGQLSNWRNVFNPHGPSFWALAALLVAVGFLHLRVNTKFGPAHGNFGLG